MRKPSAETELRTTKRQLRDAYQQLKIVSQQGNEYRVRATIKLARNETGMGLREAKDCVDRLKPSAVQ